MRTLLLLLTALLLSAPAIAGEVAVGDGLVLSLSVPAGWQLLTEPPEALVEETAEHVAHEAEALGKHPTPEQILRVARQRLSANEAILYHADSGAHLAIDFSPLAPGEEPPSLKTLKQSAEFAAESLEGEEGVSTATHTISAARVTGTEHAVRLDVDYRHHGQPVRFIGLIGDAARHWFFLYFTAPGQDPTAVSEIEEVFKSLALKTVVP